MTYAELVRGYRVVKLEDTPVRAAQSDIRTSLPTRRKNQKASVINAALICIDSPRVVSMGRSASYRMAEADECASLRSGRKTLEGTVLGGRVIVRYSRLICAVAL
jgi:hypothetical protein